MNFFIIGNASSVWMKEYIRAIHIRNNHNIYLTVYEPLSKEYHEEYTKMGVHLVVLGNKPTRVEKIYKAIRLITFSIKHRRTNEFDIVEIQSPPHNLQAYIIAICMRILKTKTFLMFWGSDILAINKKAAYRLEKILKNISVINRPGIGAYNAFKGYFGNRYEEKFTKSSLRFGTLALPYIESIAKSLEITQCKRKLGLDSDKISIAVGYNGKTRQQHIKVIEAIKNLDRKSKNRIQLVFHMAGSIDEQYVDKISEKCVEYGFSYIILKDMFDFEHVAMLRVATDVFIHAQVTDGLSGTIRECFYAGVTVINPKWIVYDELKQIGIEYIEYDSFDELNNIISKYLNGTLSIDTEKNKMLIHDNYSWEALSKDWVRTFNGMVY